MSRDVLQEIKNDYLKKSEDEDKKEVDGAEENKVEEDKDTKKLLVEG